MNGTFYWKKVLKKFALKRIGMVYSLLFNFLKYICILNDKCVDLFMILSVKSETPKNLSPGQSPKKLPPAIVKPVPIKHDPEVEKQLLIVLCDLGVETPCTSDYVCEMTSKALDRSASIDLVENLLQKFAAQQMIVYVVVFKSLDFIFKKIMEIFQF